MVVCSFSCLGYVCLGLIVYELFTFLGDLCLFAVDLFVFGVRHLLFDWMLVGL